MRLLPLLALTLFLAACRTAHPVADAPPTLPLPAESEQDAVVAAALRHAFVDARDVPDHSLLADAERVVLAAGRRVMAPGTALEGGGEAELPPLTPRMLPRAGRVRFVLLPDGEIRRLADEHGAFAHARVGAVTIDGDRATVEVATEWAVPAASDTIYLSGGGYVLELRRGGDGTWMVAGVAASWIS